MDAKSSDLSLRLKLAKLSADRVFTDSELHTVGAATVKARERDAIYRCVLGLGVCFVETGVQCFYFSHLFKYSFSFV